MKDNQDRKAIKINGCIEVPHDLTEDDFSNIFIDFVEDHGWYFGGSIKEFKEE